MDPLIVTVYVLVWPVVVAAVLFTICRGFFRELREARREGRPMV